MPALMAVISGNSDPLKRELDAVNRMVNSSSKNMQQQFSGAAMHGSAGPFRELTVLMRELSRGNYSRVPGSLSILLGQLGILKLLVKDNSSAAKVLADAWSEQSAKAALAAAAATRKAAASEAAFYADAEESEATLQQAIADKEAADAAIFNARATEQKAAASREAAAAEEMQGGAAAASVGPLGVILGLVVAVGAALYIWNKHVQAIADSMSGVKLPDLHPPDISRLSAQEEGWKKIAEAIRNAKDEYDSVSAAADRYEAALHDQHEMEKKLLEIAIKRGQARPEDMLRLEQRQQEEDLQAMVKRRDNLKKDAEAKKKQADSMHVSSAKDDSANEAELKRQAEAAREHLYGKTNEHGEKEGGVMQEIGKFDSYTRSFKGFRNSLIDFPENFWNYGFQSGDTIRKQLDGKAREDFGIIEKYDAFMRKKKGNTVSREEQQRLYDQAAKESAEAEKLTGKIKDQPAINARKNAIAKAEANAAGEGGKMMHGQVNPLQQIGAYTSAAVSIGAKRHDVGASLSKIISLLEKNTQHTEKTEQHSERIAGNTRSSFNSVQY